MPALRDVLPKELSKQPLAATAFAVAVALAVFHVYSAGFGLLDAMKQRSIHLFGMLLIATLTVPLWKGGRAARPYDLVMGGLGLAALAYIFFTFRDFAMSGGRAGTVEIVVGCALTIVTLDFARRLVGWTLPLLAVVFIAYALLGPNLPGDLAHRGVTLARLSQQLVWTQEGIFGIPVGVMANFIVLFVLLGAVMTQAGMVRFFSDISIAVAGGATGGPAKVSVISSAMLGSINGSAIANVATTGAFTIPLMKRTGIPAYYAGAVEAAASTSGQIMPPIMGAAAFVMAEIIGIPYQSIVLAALVPALFYIFGVGMAVHFQARRVGATGMDASEIPSWKAVVWKSGYLVIPFLVLIALLFRGFSPTFAGFWALVSSLVIAVVQKENRLSFVGLLVALEQGIKLALPLTAACAVVGIVVGVTNLTGLGPKLAGYIVDISGGSLLITLVFTMLTSLVLGAGLPTTAAYLVTSAIAAPALLELGVPLLASHMFVFYFAILSVLTPPLAIAGYVAAGIADAPQMKTQLTGFRLAIPAFVAPFVFVLEPSLLGMQPDGSNWPDFLLGTVTALVGVAALAMGLEGHARSQLDRVSRTVLILGAALLILPSFVWSVLGGGLFIAVLLVQGIRRAGPS